MDYKGEGGYNNWYVGDENKKTMVSFSKWFLWWGMGNDDKLYYLEWECENCEKVVNAYII